MVHDWVVTFRDCVFDILEISCSLSVLNRDLLCRLLGSEAAPSTVSVTLLFAVRCSLFSRCFRGTYCGSSIRAPKTVLGQQRSIDYLFTFAPAPSMLRHHGKGFRIRFQVRLAILPADSTAVSIHSSYSFIFTKHCAVCRHYPRHRSDLLAATWVAVRDIEKHMILEVLYVREERALDV